MTTDLAPFADTEFSMRYKEPFITGGLNKKFAVMMPRGVYRGFLLEVDSGAGDRTLQITEDSSASDHVAVYETATGYSMAIRRTTGSFLVSLTAYASETIILAIYATYAVGSTTSAVIRAYTEAEYDAAAEKDELVVLGKVAVPAASNPITAAMIYNDLRTMAWQNKAPEAAMWSPMLRNSGFEFSDAAGSTSNEYSAPPWKLQVGGTGSGTLRPSSTDPRSGDKCIEMDWSSGSVDIAVLQALFAPIAEGARFRVRLYKKMIQADVGAGSLVLIPYYLDKDGVLVAGTSIDLDPTSVDADYVEIDKVITVPSGSDIVGLQSISVFGSSLAFGSSGAAIRLDDFQLWMEVDPLDPYLFRDGWSERVAGSLTLFRLDGDFSDIPAQPKLSARSGNLRVDRSDEQSGAGVTPVGIETYGSLVGLGSSLLNSGAQARTARITSPLLEGLDNYTLLWEAEDPATGNPGANRLYARTASGESGFAFTTNAAWGGTSWTQDNVSEASFLVRFGGDRGIEVKTKGAGAPAWTTWDDDNARSPRLVATRCVDTAALVHGRSLIFDLQAPDNTGLNHSVRMYRALSGGTGTLEGVEYVNNAEWDPGAPGWRFINSGLGIAGKVVFTRHGISLYRHSGAEPWADNAWQSYWSISLNAKRMDFDDTYIRIQNTSSSISNPPAWWTLAHNRLYAKNIVKAWGEVVLGASPAIADGAGFNVSWGGYTGANAEANIDINTALDNNDYSISMQVCRTDGTPPVYIPSVNGKTTSSFKFVMLDSAFNNAPSLAVAGFNPYRVGFVIMGEATT